MYYILPAFDLNTFVTQKISFDDTIYYPKNALTAHIDKFYYTYFLEILECARFKSAI